MISWQTPRVLPIFLNRQVTIVQPIRWMVSKKALILLAFVLCTGISSVSHATSIRYEAQVLDRNGQPCFTVDQAHLTDAPRLASIEVIAESGQAEIAWREFTVAGKGDTVIFLNAVCLPYGTKLENEGAFAAPQKLTAGRHYAVMLNTDVTRGGKLENRRYRAYFCLVQQDDGSQRVQQVSYDKAVHRWNWDACGTVR